MGRGTDQSEQENFVLTCVQYGGCRGTNTICLLEDEFFLLLRFHQWLKTPSAFQLVRLWLFGYFVFMLRLDVSHVVSLQLFPSVSISSSSSSLSSSSSSSPSPPLVVSDLVLRIARYHQLKTNSSRWGPEGHKQSNIHLKPSSSSFKSPPSWRPSSFCRMLDGFYNQNVQFCKSRDFCDKKIFIFLVKVSILWVLSFNSQNVVIFDKLEILQVVVWGRV